MLGNVKIANGSFSRFIETRRTIAIGVILVVSTHAMSDRFNYGMAGALGLAMYVISESAHAKMYTLGWVS